MNLSKLDKAIKTVQFILADWKSDVAEVEKKLEKTQKEKIFVGKVTELIKNIDVLIDSVRVDVNNSLGRSLPKAHDLEEAVLGALILEANGWDQVKGFLEEEHFYTEAHTVIFKSVKRLKDAGKPVDMRTVVVELRTMGQLELIGGSFKIAELTSKVSSAASIEYHARILIEFAGKRALIQAAAKTLSDGYQDTTDFFEVLESLKSEIVKIETWIK